ncbi:conserved Plasmodium protein, unknown function [Plasmodium gallinaceum]|uniref:Sulfhydryl oxidase n=1 Tax=Plasmodium gallinaceum TaxID=5849 RepID=A0A1J1GX48_PLAGA|nr:conserved Plasmodium protein, unknown function [Plasmodium gallinaceum]CRG97047.1 conserved Plasmodium protein, unknown function [Plasmodium gallinaceum]
MIYKYKLKSLYFIFIVIIITLLMKCDELCQDADIILNNFWDKINNIKHGNVLIINIKNFYCPACNRYLNIWKKVENEILNFEKNASLFVFDCSCHLFSSYCRHFDVEYYPTFRLLFPVYDKMEGNEYIYIAPSDYIGNKTYKGNLLLAYREIQRIKGIDGFQKLMHKYLCNNVNFNHINLKSCISDLPHINKRTLDNIIVEGIINESNSLYEDEKANKWNISYNKEDIKHDIIIGLLYTLKQNISMGNDINYSSLESYIDILNIVSYIYKDLANSINEISETLRTYKYPIRYEEWIKLIQNININEYHLDEKNNLHFKVCNENSLLCTFWLLFHKISIYCLQYDKERYNFYLEKITNYTKNYLNCKNCTEHFLNAQKSCYYGFCNIHSAESFVIFLWRIHNGVTLRSMYEHIILDLELGTDNSNNKKFLNKDIVFPSKYQCENCRSGVGFTKITADVIKKLEKGTYNDQHFDAIDAFNIRNILIFLINFYS